MSILHRHSYIGVQAEDHYVNVTSLFSGFHEIAAGGAEKCGVGARKERYFFAALRIKHKVWVFLYAKTIAK